jgi:hypothetical protein
MNAILDKVDRAKDVFFGKTYELSLSKTYVSGWGMAQGVRELIQNALDSDSPFAYEFVEEGEGQYALVLNSRYSSLTPQMLLLGMSSKTNDSSKIGSFGEGFKLALLVLTRAGYDVDILNGNWKWKPLFRYSKTFDTEVLVIDEEAYPRSEGLTFTVHGLSSADIEVVRQSCLLMQRDVGETKTVEHGTILLDRPGELYVGNLFVCKTEMKFGYNIKPEHITLERDRQTVSSWDLKSVTWACWKNTDDMERVARMVADEIPDVEYVTYNCPELVKDACYRLFRERHPATIIAASPADMRAKIEAGMERVVYVGAGMYEAVRYSGPYVAERPTLEILPKKPHEFMQAFLRAQRSNMRKDAIVGFKLLIDIAEKKWIVR